MQTKKELPFIFFLLIGAVIGAPFIWKFSPLWRGNADTPPAPESAASTGPPYADSTVDDLFAPPKMPASSSPAPAGVGITIPDSQTAQPAPLSTKPELSDVLAFIDKYLALGKSSSAPYGRADVMKFPMQNFYGEPITREDWITRRKEFNRKAPFHYYERIGTALFTTGEDGSTFSAVVPIAYELRQPSNGITIDSPATSGVTIDRIGVVWDASRIWVTSHENLCTRITMKDGEGISPNDWHTGKTAASRDGSTNIRYEDSDKSDNSILKASPEGSPIQYLPQNDRWLVVKDEEGIVGFMSRNFVSPK